jgi:prohibitin 2
VLIALLLVLFGLVVLVGGGFVAWAVAHDSDGTPGNKRVGTLVGFGVAVVGVLFLLAGFGFREIGPGQVGVRVFTGQVQSGVMSPGLNWVVPFFENIVIYDTRVQAYNFENISAATDDLQEVLVAGQVNFHIEPETAPFLLQEVGSPEEYAAKVFLRPTDEALKDATPKYDAQTIVGKRREVGNLALAALNTDMDRYGIVIDRVTISNLALNSEFMNAVEQKQIAEQALARAEFEAQTNERLAQGEAQAAIAKAQGEAERIRLTAAAQADANEEINASLTPNLLQWQTIQKLSDKVRLMLLPSDQGIIFDLKGLQDEETTQ